MLFIVLRSPPCFETLQVLQNKISFFLGLRPGGDGRDEVGQRLFPELRDLRRVPDGAEPSGLVRDQRRAVARGGGQEPG